MKFRTFYHDLGFLKANVVNPNEFVTDPGNHIIPEYRAEVTDDGTIELVEDGFKNLYEEIQSHRESVELSAIVERYKQGDETVLNRRAGVYADTTKMPKTYAEILQTVIDGENIFASMPLEFRAQYNHDFNQWFAAGLPMPDKASKILEKNVAEAAKIVEKEVVSDEQKS